MAKTAKTPSAHVAIVGTGVIGASWAACFLAKGFDVVATDPAEGAEARLRGFLSGFWPALRRIGVASGASTARLKFDSDLTSTVAGAVFVQENGPEQVDIKRDLIARIDAAAPATTLIATSSSGILISEIQNAAARHPERVLVGHPFNPPHLIPLVEVVGGQATSAVAIERALAFYTALGKKPIHIRREIRGHVANRLQAALWREAFYLVSEGIASVSEVDTAISHGPGLRWALLGPFLTLHLSGGPGGVAHVLEHLGPPMESWWHDLGTVALSTELNKRVAEGVNDELAGADLALLTGQRDALLLGLLEQKAKASHLP